MIPPEKLNSALYALHLVLVELRSVSFSGEQASVVAELLDWAEAMPFLIAQPDEDRTHSFRSHLEAIAELCPRLRRALVAFEENHGFCGETAAR
jgi:hypothetical protein